MGGTRAFWVSLERKKGRRFSPPELDSPQLSRHYPDTTPTGCAMRPKSCPRETNTSIIMFKWKKHGTDHSPENKKVNVVLNQTYTFSKYSNRSLRGTAVQIDHTK
jgi:hypothetical protein